MHNLAANVPSFFLISQRRSVGGLFRGGQWLCTRSDTQILPVREADLCRSVSADGPHGRLPVRDGRPRPSADRPDHHQSPEHRSRPAAHLLQLLSDEAGVQTQGDVDEIPVGCVDTRVASVWYFTVNFAGDHVIALQPKRATATRSGREREVQAGNLQRCQITAWPKYFQSILNILSY